MSDDLSIPNPDVRAARTGRYGTGRRVTSRGMDPDMRRMAMFAAGIAGALAVLIVISLATGHHGSAVPIVTADLRPIRVKPDNPGGMKIDGAENDVFSGGTDTAEAKLAPPAEVPDTKALRAGAPPAVTPLAVTVTPPLPPPAYRSVVVSPALAKAPPVAKPAPVAEAPATRASAALTSKPAQAADLPAAKPASVAAATEPKPVAPAAARPLVVAATEAPKPAPVTEPSTGGASPAPLAAGRTMVQLAAVGSEEAARNEWQRLNRRMPDLLDERQPTFTKFERDGRVFWRVRTAGFADAAEAKAFCEKVRAQGGGCSVADF